MTFYLNMPLHKGPTLTNPVRVNPWSMSAELFKGQGYSQESFSSAEILVCKNMGGGLLSFFLCSCSTYNECILLLNSLDISGEHDICVHGIKYNLKEFPVFT